MLLKVLSIYNGSNGQSLKVEIDIAEKELKDYYKDQFDNNTNANKKWNNNATKYFSLKEDNEKYLKALGTQLMKVIPTQQFLQKLMVKMYLMNQN